MIDVTASAPCRILAGLGDVAGRYDVVLCDVWGVVHDGRRAFPAAAEALTRFRAQGGTVVLLTNAPRPQASVVSQLDGLGVPRAAYDGLVTSGDATVALIADRGGRAAYHIGPPRDLALLDEVEAKTGRAPPLAPLAEADYCICTGLFDDAVETPEDYAGVLAAALARRLDMICANPDIVVHVGDRLIFCGGALAQRYAGMGGTVLYAGKPHAPIYRVALDVAAERRGALIAADRVLAIGDGLPTDIAGARRQGLDALFVTTGIHREETLDAVTGAIDPDGLARLLGEAGEGPELAITHLVW
ncbi:MAG TPA: TIGR01459 family HAD-type hydrolase [Lichenihabitans sp.]|jgi:HAD superfamily hydrolase (TIGR01459 family)|nr:TIGR01459 family HAD-type hydrolase [Lichenihabitans sp.]